MQLREVLPPGVVFERPELAIMQIKPRDFLRARSPADLIIVLRCLSFQRGSRARYEFAAETLDQMIGVAGKRVLDIAAAIGYGTDILRQAGANVFGADKDTGSLGKWPGTKGINANLDANCVLPYPSGVFDAVVSTETIEHLDRPLIFLPEVARVLKPGGVFIISTPNRRPEDLPQSPVNPYHHSEFSKPELAKALEPLFRHIDWFGQFPLNTGLGRVPTFRRLRKYTKFMDLEDWARVRPYSDGANFQYMFAVCKK